MITILEVTPNEELIETVFSQSGEKSGPLKETIDLNVPFSIPFRDQVDMLVTLQRMQEDGWNVEVKYVSVPDNEFVWPAGAKDQPNGYFAKIDEIKASRRNK